MPRISKKYHFIYKTTNISNGKYYYGLHSTNNLDDGYLGSGRRLRYSINKYGKENHTREIIEFCKNRKDLVKREKEIVNLNEITKKDCLNLIIGGAPIKSLPKDARQRIADSRKGKPLSIETRNKMSEVRKGKIHNDETKEKIRNTLIGSTLTKERKNKISKTKKLQLNDKKNHPFYGKTHSDESKIKMSNAQKGVPKKKLKCPYCDKVGGEPQLKQWHFNNCKNRLIN